MPRRDPPAISDRIRVQHILEAARHVVQFVHGRRREDLDTDPMLLRAVLNALQEIGEAAARMSDAGRARVPGVPWGQVVETRHILVHVYWGVNRTKIWATATQDMQPLIVAIEQAIVNWPLPADDERPPV
ncbi:MAG TPA: HepT-like ribonuclease domain-containing protein [Phycisphaerales bacterium]|nr:HepT-like ribonuclease domain-containing protein [Phycisphaerales bacterium]